jgi:hypothetical protein
MDYLTMPSFSNGDLSYKTKSSKISSIFVLKKYSIPIFAAGDSLLQLSIFPDFML